MRIAEIFYSVQGEGSLTGLPSVFVRTSGCNLRCAWCDTPYASWQPEGDEMSLEAILDQVEQYPSRYVVVTGGEPMVARAVRTFLAELRRRGKHVTLETAGTIPPEECVVDLVSLSPKLANSTPSEERAGLAWVQRHEQTRLQPEVLRQWLNAALDYQLKFVISTAADLEEARGIVASIGETITICSSKPARRMVTGSVPACTSNSLATVAARNGVTPISVACALVDLSSMTP
jgi:7-carboxy-7-deazaguanine synthase